VGIAEAIGEREKGKRREKIRHKGTIGTKGQADPVDCASLASVLLF